MLLKLSILFAFLLLLILAISKWKVHPFVALILIALGLGLALDMGGEKTVEVLLTGFSDSLKWIAIIIMLGAFIGEVFQETGGAFRIADRIISRVGERKLHWAMGFTGYLISIPVFVDVAYILLQPVTESLARKSKKPVLFIGLALTAGLTVSHTLIPPTPGPLAVASLLELDLARMLWVNLTVAAFSMTGGVLFVMYFVKNAWIEYDDKLAEEVQRREKETSTTDSPEKASLLFDLLPILVPILLIGSGSFIEFEQANVVGKIFEFISLPLVAVLIGACIAIFQLKNEDKSTTINRLVEQAIIKSALVIMITGAGGAFGHVIRESGIQNEIADTFSAFPFLGIFLPFILASVLTISTGSITVSLVGTASMVGSMMEVIPLSPEIVGALISSGAFCVFHANSSFFWLLNRLHEVPPNTLYKTYTLQSLVMGLSGLIGVFLLILFGI